MLNFKIQTQKKVSGFGLQSTPSCSSESHDCCTPKPKGKAACPKCANLSKGVLGKTLEHLLKEQRRLELGSLDGFYYCTTPECEVVYFKDEMIVTQKDMTVSVGLKEGASPVTTCYCFGWTKEKIRAELEANAKTEALEDIKQKMATLGCECEIKNPSGGCCLGENAKVIKELKAELGL